MCRRRKDCVGVRGSFKDVARSINGRRRERICVLAWEELSISVEGTTCGRGKTYL